MTHITHQYYLIAMLIVTVISCQVSEDWSECEIEPIPGIEDGGTIFLSFECLNPDYFFPISLKK